MRSFFLGLQSPKDGRDDPISVESVRVSLAQTVNLANLNSLTLGFTDWMDGSGPRRQSGRAAYGPGSDVGFVVGQYPG